MKNQRSACESCSQTVPRRDLFRLGTAGAVTATLGSLFPGCKDAQRVTRVARPSRSEIGKLSELNDGDPVLFAYPAEEAAHNDALLIKLGREAGGGIGPDKDIVAFSAFCTHMGGSLIDGYLAAHQVLGCSEHLTTFDLTRHGMVVAGHATQSLPQILLELDGDSIVATGVIGLLYGHDQNPAADA